MIDRQVIMDCAEQAGFGGASRPKLLPRLERFAELLLEHQQHRYVDACVALGDAFEILKTEFSDGQMDGAYRCAEIIQVGAPALQSHCADARYSQSTQAAARSTGSAYERVGPPQDTGSEKAGQRTDEKAAQQEVIHYFGERSDILESLGNELSACATMHDGSVKTVIEYLSTQLLDMSPVLIALEKYCTDKATAFDVSRAFLNFADTRKARP